MKWHWINLFNMIESEGGFESADAAKIDAIKTFVEIQNGTALHIGIGNDDGPVCEGSIKNGKWIDGRPTLSPTQIAVGENYRAMVKRMEQGQ